MLLTLDIAFKNTGWSVIHGGQIVEYGTIRTVKTKVKGTLVSDDRATRAAHLAAELNKIILKHDVKAIVGEMPSGSQNATASNLLGWASGVVVAIGVVHGIPCEWISQGDSKQAAFGKRTATKDESMKWARDTFPFAQFPREQCNFEHVSDSLLAYNGLKNGILVRTFG